MNGDMTGYLWLIFGTMILVGILLYRFGGWF